MQESDLLFILCITYDLNFLKYALEAVEKTELEENRSVRQETCQKCSVNDDGGSDTEGNGGEGEDWMNSKCAYEVDVVGLVERLDEGVENQGCEFFNCQERYVMFMSASPKLAQ